MKTEHRPFAGRTVVVTGASRGQGHAIALTLAERGARVIALDLDAQADYPETAIEYRRLDVASEPDWTALAATLAGSTVHGLVNNAGIAMRSRLGDVQLDGWNRVLSVNLTGAMLGMRTLAPLMIDGSSIVNVGSTAALTGHYPVAYTASKWGLRGLTHSAATELGPRGIRVNIVHPGFIETAMTANAPAAMLDAHLELTPLERSGAPSEVAEVVAFLLSDAAGYLTGTEIPIDGGTSSSGGAKLIADRIARAAPRI